MILKLLWFEAENLAMLSRVKTTNGSLASVGRRLRGRWVIASIRPRLESPLSGTITGVCGSVFRAGQKAFPPGLSRFSRFTGQNRRTTIRVEAQRIAKDLHQAEEKLKMEGSSLHS